MSSETLRVAYGVGPGCSLSTLWLPNLPEAPLLLSMTVHFVSLSLPTHSVSTRCPMNSTLPVPLPSPLPLRDTSDLNIFTVVAECISSARIYAFILHLVLTHFVLLALQIVMSFVLLTSSLPCFSICSQLHFSHILFDVILRS